MRLQRVLSRSGAEGTRTGAAGDPGILGVLSTFTLGAVAGATTGGAPPLLAASFVACVAPTAAALSGFAVITDEAGARAAGSPMTVGEASGTVADIGTGTDWLETGSTVGAACHRLLMIQNIAAASATRAISQMSGLNPVRTASAVRFDGSRDSVETSANVSRLTAI